MKMKNIILAFTIAFGTIAFGYTNEQHKAELKESFEMHLQNGEYNEAARCCLEYEIVPNAFAALVYNGMTYSFDTNDDTEKMNLDLWNKWNGTQEEIQLKYFKFMCM